MAGCKPRLPRPKDRKNMTVINLELTIINLGWGKPDVSSF